MTLNEEKLDGAAEVFWETVNKGLGYEGSFDGVTEQLKLLVKNSFIMGYKLSETLHMREDDAGQWGMQ